MSVQAFGSFVKTPTDNGINQSATNSGGVLANYRFFFSPSNGIEVNYGYSLNTQTYGLESGPLGVKSDQHEVSAAYVFRHKMHGFTPFAEAGADIDITNKFFVRAEFRGFVYQSSTYGLLAFQGADRVTHRAEPSVGFGYRF